MSEAQSTVTKVIEVDVKASKDAAAQIKKMSDSMGELDKTAKKTQGVMEGMFTNMKGLVGFLIFDKIAEVAMRAAMAINAMSDASNVLNARMKQVTGSSSEAAAAFQDIVSISIAHGRELDGVAKLYEKVSRNSDNLGVTMRGTRLTTEGFAASLRLSGANTQEAYASMLQFSQALASGKLAGDEFRSILENNAVFMYELAKAAGVSQGKLKEMSKDGKIDMEFLQKALFKVGDDGLNMLQRFIEKSENIPLTFDQAMNGLWSSMTNFIDAMKDTADRTEGFFTRMAKNVAASINEAAGYVRETSVLRSERAKANGQAPDPADAGEETKAQKRARYEAERQKQMDLFDRLTLRRIESESASSKGKRPNLLNALIDSLNIPSDKQINDARGAINAYTNLLYDMDQAALAANQPFTKPITGLDGKKEKKAGAPKENWMVDYLIDLNFELAKATSEVDGTLSKLDKREQDFYEKVAKKGGGTDPKLMAAIVDPENGVLKQLRMIDAAKAAAKFGVENQKFESDKVAKDLKDQSEAVEKYYDLVKKNSPADAIYLQIEEINRVLGKMTDPEKIAKLEELRLAMFWDADRLENNTKAYEKAADRIGRAFEGAAENAAGAMLDFMSGTKVGFGAMIADILRGIAKVELELQLKPAMRGVGSWLTGLFDTRQAPNLTTWSDITPSANGNVFGPGGLQYFAKGGVVNGATGFNFSGGTGVMGEAGPEAVMPLKRDGTGNLGVGAAPVTINVINNNGSKVSTTETKNSNGSVRIDVMIEDMVEKGIVGGRFDSAMTASYGVSRRGR